MITKMGISGLKCFNNDEFKLKPFTLLTGMNSAGKSTFIQAILLAIQNITENATSPLNGKYITLGEYSEAKNYITNAKSIMIYLENNFYERITIDIKEDDGDIKCLIKSDNEKIISSRDFKYFYGTIHYISSNRIGIQDVYDKNYSEDEEFGNKGEFAFNYYNKHKRDILSDIIIKDASTKTLDGQLNYWLKYVLNCQLITEDIKGTDKIKVSYSYGNNTRAVRPKNIGTGLSYVISLMIAGLSSKKGDLLIIENPEIHLHPKAQSKITEFIAFLADKGIQFVIETHSDHVFNGIRKSIKKEIIKDDDVITYFFRIDESTLLCSPVQIIINEYGIIENHQKGLFDQFDDDLDELLGI